MGSSIKAMWTNRDIRNRILFTLFAFLVYRLGCAITVPDVNTTDLVAGLGDNSLFAMLNLLGGGGLEQFSVFALGVTPYITASIIIQLLSMDVIPSLTELSKSGANGRSLTNTRDIWRWSSALFSRCPWSTGFHKVTLA